VTHNNSYNYYISSQSISSNFKYEEAKTYIGDEEDHISFTCKDGYESSLSLKNYILFIILNGVSPSECKDKEEYESKIGTLII